MSHAANLRLRHRPSLSEASAKRRKISDSLSSPRQNGVKTLPNGLSTNKKLTAVPVQNVKSHVDHRNGASHAVVGHGEAAPDVDMADVSTKNIQARPSTFQDAGEEEEEDDESNEDEGVHVEPMQKSDETAVTILNGADNEEEREPSFGDLLRARNLDVVAVDASLPEPGASEKDIASHSANRILSVPSATSLGTVLTQALKTNDVDLLESCLQIPSLESIRATVQRLHSSLATLLLQKLAERLHKRPGRAGSLMVWVQWTIVAHGGYLATQPAAMKQIHTLYQVVKQRAAGLQPLLSLKGRLDMLEAQMQMRRNLQQASKNGMMGDEERTTVIYVEGEEEEEENAEAEDEDEDENDVDDDVAAIEAAAHGSHNSARKTEHGLSLEIPDSDEEDGDMPMTITNGIDASDDGEVASGSSEEEDDLIDDEAEESEDDSNDLSEEVDFDDVEDAAEESQENEESEAEPQPSRRLTVSQKDNGRRKHRS